MNKTNILYLVRHGESIGNLNHGFLGTSNPPLTERGTKQACNLAQYFRDKGIQHLFSSPLERARQTANYISKDIGVTPAIDKNLIEQDFGTWDGVPVKEIAETNSQE